MRRGFVLACLEMAEPTALRIHVSERIGHVSALLQGSADAHALLVLAHGAGADMRHVFMETLATELANAGVATLRYQFPYSEKGQRRPSPQPVLLATVRAALATGARETKGRPLLAGGKSMGGRMTSLVVAGAAESADSRLPKLNGLVFVGFPLHGSRKPSSERADHLARVPLPMLFLQGTRDPLADLTLLAPICEGLGSRGELHVVDDADHSFHVPKRAGRTDEEILTELAERIARFARDVS